MGLRKVNNSLLLRGQHLESAQIHNRYSEIYGKRDKMEMWLRTLQFFLTKYGEISLQSHGPHRTSRIDACRPTVSSRVRDMLPF